jgi:DNA-binding GntR family transcriptional regulator
LKPLPQLVRSSLGGATVELLRERILSGEYGPGTRLVEAEIARQLGISRGPVREALATLQGEGLTTEMRGRSSFVQILTRDDIRGIYDVRATLESGAIRLLLERNDPLAVAKVVDAAKELERASSGPLRDAFVEADLDVHEQLCRAAGNERLLRAWFGQVALLRALLRLEVAQVAADPVKTTQTHLEMVEALVAGHEQEAVDLCWRLFREAAAALGAALEARRDGAGATPSG